MIFPGAARAVATVAMREAVDEARAALPEIACRIRARVAPLYPDIDEAIAWLWVRTVKSPSPRFTGRDVPLVRSFALSKKRGIWLKPVVNGDEWRFGIAEGGETDEKGLLYRDGGEFKCLLSGETITREWIESEYRAGRGGMRCVARVLKGKRYEAIADDAAERESGASLDLGPIDTPRAKALFGRYGMESWRDLFLPRQRAALAAMEEEIAAEKNLGDAARLLLRLGVAHSANRNSTLSIWDHAYEKTYACYRMGTYLRMSWLFSETNPFGGSSGDFADCCNGVIDAVAGWRRPQNDSSDSDDGVEVGVAGVCDGEDIESFLGGFLTAGERKHVLPKRIVAKGYEDLKLQLRESPVRSLRYRVPWKDIDTKNIQRMVELKATVAAVLGAGLRFVSFVRDGNIVRFETERIAGDDAFVTRREVRLAAAAADGGDELARFGQTLCAIGGASRVLAADGNALTWPEVVDLIAENIKRNEVTE